VATTRSKSKPAAAAPDTFDDLVSAIQDRLDTLSPSHRVIGERVLADPEGVAFMTVSELAAATGVNESTVVRFATNLGLSGYPALVRLCQARLRDQAQMLRRFDSFERLSPDEAATLRARAAAYDQANIARTFARIDVATWDKAVAALSDAPTVYVLGLRKCYAPAYLLGYLLRLVRDDVHTLSTGPGTLADEVRQVRAGDAFVAMSIHRYTADTVRGFEYATEAGAECVALTDNPSSPLARHAGSTLYVDTAGAGVLRSVTAFASLAQALAGDVAVRRGANARSSLLTEESMLEAFGAYLTDR
jgi:DNA-binding MurR/RpiR family transcriptional regulator